MLSEEKKKTILSLSAIGDILLTCTSLSSRNYSLGYSIGKGKKKDEVLKNKSSITEGVENSKALFLIKKKLNLETPIIDAVYKILVKNYSTCKIVDDLLSRPSGNE